MRLLTLTILLVLLVVCPTKAQSNLEYGQLDELNGVKKVYVNTGTDLDGRENIIKVIKKDLPDLVIVSRVEEAEIALIYCSDSYAVLRSIMQSGNSTTNGRLSVWGNTGTYSERTNSTSTTTPIYRNVTDGAGLVVKFTGNGSSRLLMDFKDKKTSILERRPSTNFARKFVKTYKDFNSTSASRSQLSSPIPPSESRIDENPNSQRFDLNGIWNYGDGAVRVSHTGQTVKITYASQKQCSGSDVTELLSGQLQGSSLSGKMTICTNGQLVTRCGFPRFSQIAFTATIDTSVIAVRATLPGITITYGNNERCSVLNDNTLNSEDNFILTRRE
jgi:hypothetical protein